MSESHIPGLVEPIDPDECLELLARKSKVGRVGFLEGEKPMILPVNYIFDDGSVVFCTGEGSKLSGLGDGAPVAFEIDDSISLHRSGWSVLVHGKATHMTDADDLQRLSRSQLQSWGRGSTEFWVRISIDEISGRRVSPAG